jgi:hypothetical protein
MIGFTSASRLFAVILASTLIPAMHAQATRTWVSGVGDDANPCSRTAPCKTFAGAISKTAAGGEISVLDPGGFGGVTITKSITINGDGQLASVLVSGTHGIIVNAGSGDVVTLRNLSVNGLGTGLSGVRFLNGLRLVVEQCKISGFQTGVEASLGHNADVIVNNTTIDGGSNGITAATSSGRVVGMLSNLQIHGSTNIGIDAETNADMNVSDSNISQTNIAVQASAAGSTIRMSNLTIINNVFGIGNGGGATISFKNNHLNGNGTDGTPTYLVNPL